MTKNNKCHLSKYNISIVYMRHNRLRVMLMSTSVAIRVYLDAPQHSRDNIWSIFCCYTQSWSTCNSLIWEKFHGRHYQGKISLITTSLESAFFKQTNLNIYLCLSSLRILHQKIHRIHNRTSNHKWFSETKIIA